jgi:hypothetical protein
VHPLWYVRVNVPFRWLQSVHVAFVHPLIVSVTVPGVCVACEHPGLYSL